MASREGVGPGDGPEGAGDARSRPALVRRITGGVRTRILASYLILLAIAAFASVLAVRQVMLVRLDDRVEEDLQQEVGEFRNLAEEGVDPETGRPFGTDIKAIFETYLERNVPDDDEELITVPREGQAKRDPGSNTQEYGFADFVDRWRTLDAVERGEIDTPGGPARYVAIPVELEGSPEPLGTFAVAIFTADERNQVDEAVQIVAIVAAVVLLLGSVIGFSITGRVLAPLRELRDAARSVTGTQMDRRIQVESDDEIAELAQAFNRMLDRLVVAFASQREFIRDVSHELRTPIAISRGHLELLAQGHLTDETERREAIALVTGELDRMGRFVDDLLLLARAESPDFLQLETVPLAALVQELVAKASPLADRRWTVDEDSPRSVVADRQRLTQALMNLAQNAVAHTEPGDEIAFGAAVNGERASVWVRDTGTGIPPSEQRRIFSRFSRGSHSRDRYEGTGIGLAIVRAIAEAHGGRVRVTSRLGEGARFELLLPIEQDQPPDEDWAIEVGS
ncbi:MAG TPA: HAMP domain-containing sensor histidine kinase [Solirubrobacterales bacterium]|nr:HAMP domain-containing sensor histidine kinase [Solirubrobacterales bacterium]